MSHAGILQKNHDILQRCTTINFYVIDYLRAEDVLDEEQEHDLKTEKNPLRQRILLYQWLKRVSSDKFESFLQVMKDTEQEHVTNLLKGSAEQAYLPLSDARHRRLVKIRHKMAQVTRIDNELIAELRSHQAISMTDAEEIRAEKVESTRVSKLISVIMRRSNHSCDCFQDALRKTLQKAAANFLSEGEMPAVHLNNSQPDLDAPLSHAFNDVLMTGTENDPEIMNLLSDLNELGLHPVNAIPGQSIVIFIYCRTVQSAVTFTQLFKSGRLQYIFESILNRLLLKIEPRNMDEFHSRLSLEAEDIVSLEKFTGIEDWVTAADHTRPKPSKEIHGCDIDLQTDKVSFVKKITGWIRENVYRPKPSEQYQTRPKERKPYEKYMVSSMFADDVMNRELSQIKELAEKMDTMRKRQTRLMGAIACATVTGKNIGKESSDSEGENSDRWDSSSAQAIERKFTETTRIGIRSTMLLVFLISLLSILMVCSYLFNFVR